MKYSTFCILCDHLKPFIQRSVTRFRHPIKVKRAVAMVVNKLAYGDTSRRIINVVYCVGASTIYKYTLTITKPLQTKTNYSLDLFKSLQVRDYRMSFRVSLN